MTRKTATATKETAQSALFGAEAPQAAKPIVSAKPAKKTGTAISTKIERVAPHRQRSLIDRLREISDAKDVVLAREILAMIRSEEDRIAERAFNDDVEDHALQTTPGVGCAGD